MGRCCDPQSSFSLLFFLAPSAIPAFQLGYLVRANNSAPLGCPPHRVQQTEARGTPVSDFILLLSTAGLVCMLQHRVSGLCEHPANLQTDSLKVREG